MPTPGDAAGSEPCGCFVPTAAFLPHDVLLERIHRGDGPGCRAALWPRHPPAVLPLSPARGQRRLCAGTGLAASPLQRLRAVSCPAGRMVELPGPQRDLQ